MPVSFEIRQEGQGVIVTVSGHVEAGELLTMVSNPAVGDLLKTLRYMVFDFTEVERLSLTMSDVGHLSEAVKSAMTRGVQRRFAAFVAPQDLVFGQARQIEALTGDESERDAVIRIFRARDAAESWINTNVTKVYGAEAAPFAPPA